MYAATYLSTCILLPLEEIPWVPTSKENMSDSINIRNRRLQRLGHLLSALGQVYTGYEPNAIIIVRYQRLL